MSDRHGEMIFYALALLLPLSALIARRQPLGATIKMAFAWVAIFAVGLILVAQRDRLPSWRVLLDDQQVTGTEARIGKAEDGHFWATVEINGTRRRMLVDSGATTTALSMATAHATGLDLDESSFPTLIETANCTVSARRSTIKRLVLGPISADDLPVVVAPAFGDTDVLGMNFLSRLGSWRAEGRTLILTPEHRQ